jgi:excinuclease ABC subunit C
VEPAAKEVGDIQGLTAEAPLFHSVPLGTACRRWHPGMALVEDLAHCRTRLRRLCPTTPGVYYWFDPTGKLVYVGKAKSLRHRLQGYFQASPAEEKMRRIRDVSTRLVWEETSHEFLALVREQEVIIQHRPTWNVQGQPKRQRFAFLCVSKHRAANIYVSFDQTPNADIYFGPILGSGRLREAAENLNHQFALRDCSERTPIDFSQQLLLFPLERDALCLRHEIGTCLGPCAAKVSADDYQASVARAIAFLQGYDRQILQQLQQEMQRAAAAQRYEKAASLRDRCRLLQWVDRRLEDLRKTRYEYNCVYRLPEANGTEWWALLVQGCVRAVVRRPQKVRPRRLVERLLRQALDQAIAATPPTPSKRREPASPPAHRTRSAVTPASQDLPDWGPLSAQVPQLLMQSLTNRWFRRNSGEKSQLLSYHAALELLAD